MKRERMIGLMCFWTHRGQDGMKGAAFLIQRYPTVMNKGQRRAQGPGTVFCICTILEGTQG